MESNKDKISRRVLFFVIGISILFIVILVFAFVYYFSHPHGVVIQDSDAGSVLMTYTDDSPQFELKGATPISSDVGRLLSAADQYFDFTITTDLKNSSTVDYEIALIKDVSSSNILDNNIQIYLEKEDSGSYSSCFGPKKYISLTKKSDIGSPKGSMVIHKETKTKNSVDNYRLRMWLSDKAMVTPDVLQNYVVKVVVHGKAS